MIEWILTALGILGAVLNSYRRIEGFYIWLVGNTGWIIFGLYTGTYGLSAMFTVYNCLALLGIHQWRKKCCT